MHSELKNSTGVDFDKADLARARVIAKCDDLTDQVFAGAMYFKTAFDEASRRRKEAEKVEAYMTRLHAEAPDLATIVLEEKGMTAAEAIGALDQRQRIAADKAAEEQREAERQAAEKRKTEQRRTEMLCEAISMFNPPQGADPKAMAKRLFSEINLELWPALSSVKPTFKCWAIAAITMKELAELLKGVEQS
jgi:hypothetical protein